MAQDPETAEHSTMPSQAIATGLVDYVLPVEKMAAALTEYIDRSKSVTFPAAGAHGRSPDLEPVLRALAQAGSEFRGYKRGTLERPIARRMTVKRVSTLDAYCDILRNDVDEAEALSLDMMIGVTEFFRDPEAWQVLSERVLASLLAEPEGDQPLRVWGCRAAQQVRKRIRWRFC